MKTRLKLLTIIMGLLGHYPLLLTADNGATIHNVNMEKKPKEKPERKPEYNRPGNRAPSHPVLCTISMEDGIMADFADSILTYEVWAPGTNSCIINCSDEEIFIDYLFNVPGDYEIRLSTDEYFYIGFLSNY